MVREWTARQRRSGWLASLLLPVAALLAPTTEVYPAASSEDWPLGSVVLQETSESALATTETCGERRVPEVPIWVSERWFKKVVLRSQVPVVVDFSASWCGPCRAMEAPLRWLAAEYAGRLIVVRVDIDEEDSLAWRFGVDLLPTTILIADGKVVERKTGALSRRQLEQLVEDVLPPSGREPDISKSAVMEATASGERDSR